MLKIDRVHYFACSALHKERVQRGTKNAWRVKQVTIQFIIGILILKFSTRNLNIVLGPAHKLDSSASEISSELYLERKREMQLVSFAQKSGFIFQKNRLLFE